MYAKKSFEDYHALNPDIYTALRLFAFEAVRAGRTRIGIKLLFERVRWFTTVEAKGDPWRLNNTHSGRYARLLMEQEPELQGLFETRSRRPKT